MGWGLCGSAFARVSTAEHKALKSGYCYTMSTREREVSALHKKLALVMSNTAYRCRACAMELTDIFILLVLVPACRPEYKW